MNALLNGGLGEWEGGFTRLREGAAAGQQTPVAYLRVSGIGEAEQLAGRPEFDADVDLSPA